MDRVIQSLAEGGRISIEVIPPARGGDIEEIKNAVGLIMPHRPAFVSVTDHPAGRAWADSTNGPSRVALRTKPGTLGTAVAIREEFRVQTVPHLVSSGADRLAMEDLLIDLHYAGFRDIFVVRGDERYSPPGLRADACEGQPRATPMPTTSSPTLLPSMRGAIRRPPKGGRLPSLSASQAIRKNTSRLRTSRLICSTSREKSTPGRALSSHRWSSRRATTWSSYKD